jgi:hypothetical protein
MFRAHIKGKFLKAEPLHWMLLSTTCRISTSNVNPITLDESQRSDLKSQANIRTCATFIHTNTHTHTHTHTHVCTKQRRCFGEVEMEQILGVGSRKSVSCQLHALVELVARKQQYQNCSYTFLDIVHRPVLFRIHRFRDWILCPSAGGAYTVWHNRWS